MVKAVEASIYIPFYAGPRLATTCARRAGRGVAPSLLAPRPPRARVAPASRLRGAHAHRAVPAPTPRPRARPRSFRGMLAYDGSFGGHGPGFLPCPGPENNVTYCIRVSSLPAKMKVAECFGSLMRSGTARDRARWFNVAGKMLQPAYLVAHLESAGAAYAREATSFEPAQTQRMIDAVNQLVTPGEGEADIFPGRRHKLPYSPLYWLTIMMNPGVRAAAAAAAAAAPCARAAAAATRCWGADAAPGIQPAAAARAAAAPLAPLASRHPRPSPAPARARAPRRAPSRSTCSTAWARPRRSRGPKRTGSTNSATATRSRA